MDVAGENMKPGAHVILWKKKSEIKPNQNMVLRPCRGYSIQVERFRHGKGLSDIIMYSHVYIALYTIDVKNVFYVFYFKIKNTFFNVFIF